MRTLEEPWYFSTIREFLLSDAPRLIGIPCQHFVRDVTTLERRLAAEGESLLTKTLPAFGKAIDLALQGHVPLATRLFKKRGRSALPAFLSALLRRVFKDDGWIMECPCFTSIRLLRQITFWCKKIKKEYSDESLQRATEDFKDVDRNLPDHLTINNSNGNHLVLARALLQRVLRNIGVPLAAGPRHGPGAVAQRFDAVEKRELRTSFSDLEKVFRPIPWFRSLRDASEDPSCVYGRPREKYGLSRTAFVPKDSSGPRTIGLEPAEYMWCQQAVKGLLYNHIQTKPNLAKGHVNFDDQTINRALAQRWIDYETLDMSKASDRNSYALVEYLFEGSSIWPYMRASRTPGTVLPNGETLMYKKFAPMGSAVCFPAEALVFWALAVATCHISGGIPLMVACKRVFVYGDDLIVPRGIYSSLEEVFTSVGLTFNADKCCTHGKFRESCGMDSFDGVDVTPTRLKVVQCESHSDIAKLVQHTNMLFRAGYRAASLVHRALVEKIFLRPQNITLPCTWRQDLPILAWETDPSDETLKYAHNAHTSITSIRGWHLSPNKIKVPNRRSVQLRIYRESLSLGGPVGCLSKPPVQDRSLDAKYSTTLRKKRFVVVREYSRDRSIQAPYCIWQPVPNRS